jgi:membrane protein YqaA with SNARE-associated domain
MDALVEFLIQWGYLGVFLAALLAGTVIPLSSDVVLAALIYPSTGLDPVICILWASIGNFCGGLTCYWLGRLGKVEWLEKYFKMKHERVERTQRYLNGKGVFMVFFSFLPLVGDLIPAAFGLMRTNVYTVSAVMFAGKLTRYVVVALAARGLFTLFV